MACSGTRRDRLSTAICEPNVLVTSSISTAFIAGASRVRRRALPVIRVRRKEIANHDMEQDVRRGRYRKADVSETSMCRGQAIRKAPKRGNCKGVTQHLQSGPQSLFKSRVRTLNCQTRRGVNPGKRSWTSANKLL